MRYRSKKYLLLWLNLFGELSAYFLQLLVLLLLALGMGAAIKAVNYLAAWNNDALMKVAPILFAAPLVICAIVTFSFGLMISTKRLCRGLGKIAVR
jgi:uncharacterized membrane protein YciS (DUF1049 family)